jgi:hypothetical protein
MKCKVCGCNDERGCIIEGDTDKGEDIVTVCHWVMDGLCSACFVELPPGENCFKGNVGLIIPKACEACAHLVEDKEAECIGYKNYWHCAKGRFDTALPDGAPVPGCWAWIGIQRPNKAVAAAQKKCPFFEVHPRYRKQTNAAH